MVRHRPSARRIAAVAAVLVLSSAATASSSAAQSELWYVATYTNDILVWDEATEQVVDRITVRNAIPTGITVNEAKDRLYVREASSQRIEIVDLESGESLGDLTLSEGNVTVRISGFAPHPSDERAAMFVKRYTKLDDRYVVEGPFLVEYDLVERRVSDTIPWPDGEQQESLGFQYSPDGETLYLFADDIIALDSETFEETGRWEISQPLEPGLGRPSFGVFGGTYDEEGVATSLFRMTDPAQNRRMMGIARVRLSEQEVEFYTLGEAQPVGRFNVAPGGEKAYGLYSDIGRYEFWEFDLVGRRVVRRVPFAGRPRMGMQVSADGTKLYIHTAGSTIDVYDTATFEYLRTVTFEADMTDVAVVPVS